MEEAARAIWFWLAAAVFPLWLAAGVLDYACHRRERIELTTGRTEPLLHLAEAAQVGVGLLLVLFCELSVFVLAIVGACVLLHTATSWFDIAYSATRRRIGATEQFAHAFLIGMPLVATGMLVCLRLAGEGVEAGGLQPRTPAFPPAVVVAVLAGGVLVSVAPGVAEWWRASRAARA